LDESVSRGGNGESLDLAAALGPGGAVDDPFAEHAILPGITSEPPAAAVIDLPGCFEQKQAVVRVREIDAAAQEVAGQGGIGLAGVVAEQRQAESALALEGAVAGAGVTAHATEEAHDMALEVHIAEGGSPRQSNRRLCSRRRKSGEDGQGKKDK